MRGIANRLRAVLALAAAPLAMAQSPAPPAAVTRVLCEAAWQVDAESGAAYSYLGDFDVVRNTLVQHASPYFAATHAKLAPSEVNDDAGWIAAHDVKPALWIAFNDADAVVGATVRDGAYTFKRHPVTATVLGYDDKTPDKKSDGYSSVTEAQLADSVDTELTFTPGVSIARVTWSVVVPSVNKTLALASQSTFPTNMPVLSKRATVYRRLGNTLFAGTPYMPTAAAGGRTDKKCRPFSTKADPGCYLTTATVHTLGLADDCWELRQLRAFRDRLTARGGSGAQLVARYYADAPDIVRAIARRADAKRIWQRTYLQSIVPAAIASALHCDRLALRIYTRMTRNLAKA